MDSNKETEQNTPQGAENALSQLLSREQRFMAQNTLDGLIKNGRLRQSKGEPPPGTFITPRETPEPIHNSTQVSHRQPSSNSGETEQYFPNSDDQPSDMLSRQGFDRLDCYIESPYTSAEESTVIENKEQEIHQLEKILHEVTRDVSAFTATFDRQANWQKQLFGTQMDLHVRISMIRDKAMKLRQGNMISACFGLEKEVKEANESWTKKATHPPMGALHTHINKTTQASSISSTLLECMAQDINTNLLNFQSELGISQLETICNTDGLIVPEKIASAEGSSGHGDPSSSQPKPSCQTALIEEAGLGSGLEERNSRNLLGFDANNEAVYDHEVTSHIPYNFQPRRRSLQDEILEAEANKTDTSVTTEQENLTSRPESENSCSQDDVDLTIYDRGDGDLPTLKFIIEDIRRRYPDSLKDMDPSAWVIAKKFIQLEQKIMDAGKSQESITLINQGIIEKETSRQKAIKDIGDTVNDSCINSSKALELAKTLSQNHERQNKETLAKLELLNTHLLSEIKKVSDSGKQQIKELNQRFNAQLGILSARISSLEGERVKLDSQIQFLISHISGLHTTHFATASVPSFLKDHSLPTTLVVNTPPITTIAQSRSNINPEFSTGIPGISRNMHVSHLGGNPPRGVMTAQDPGITQVSQASTQGIRPSTGGPVSYTQQLGNTPPIDRSSPQLHQNTSMNVSMGTVDHETMISRDLLKEHFNGLLSKLERMISKRVTADATHDQVQEGLRSKAPQVEKVSKQCSEVFIKYSGYPDRDFVLCKRGIRIMNEASEWVADVRDIADDRESYSQPLAKESKDLKAFSNDGRNNIFEFFKRFEAVYGRRGTDKDRAEILTEKYLIPRIALQIAQFKNDYTKIRCYLEEKYGDVATITNAILDDLGHMKKPTSTAPVKQVAVYLTALLTGIYSLSNLSDTPGINKVELELCIFSRAFLKRIRELLPEAHLMRFDRRVSDKELDPERITGKEGFDLVIGYIKRELVGMDSVAREALKKPAEVPRERPKKSPLRTNMVVHNNNEDHTSISSSEGEEEDNHQLLIASAQVTQRTKPKPSEKKPKKWSKDGLKFPCPMEKHSHELGECEEFLNSTSRQRLKQARQKLCFACLGPWIHCHPRCSNTKRIPKELVCLECNAEASKQKRDPFCVLVCGRVNHTKPVVNDIVQVLGKWFPGFSGKGKVNLHANLLIAAFMPSCHKCGTDDLCACSFPTKSSAFDPFAETPIVDTSTGKDITVPRDMIIRETNEATSFVMQWLTIRGKDFLTFYDRGASQHLIKGEMAEDAQLKVVNPRPSSLTVVGGSTISTDYGLYRMALGKTEEGKVHEIVCQGITTVTGNFPKLDLQELNEEVLSTNHKALKPKEVMPPEVGGSEVHLLLGIKDTELEPKLIFSLNGLGVYRSKLKDKFGSYLCYGGPHKVFTDVLKHSGSGANHLMVMFINSYRNSIYDLCSLRDEAFEKEFEDNGEGAYVQKDNGNIFSLDNDLEFGCKSFPTPLTQADFWESNCSTPLDSFDKFDGACHADANKDINETSTVVHPAHHCPILKAKIPLSRLKGILDQNDIDDSVTYRCADCAKCIKCKESSKNKAISLNEAIEQEFIDKSVHIDLEKSQVLVDMPFLKEPTEFLSKRHNSNSNFVQARSVYRKQCQKPQIVKEGVRMAQQSMVDKGFMARLDSLPDDVQGLINSSEFRHYYVWRCCYKLESKSSSVRIVVDPTMSGLNLILPKGENRLGRTIDILLRVRCKEFIWTSDISKFYNQLKLTLGSYPFSLFLYHTSMEPSVPPEVWVLLSAWYGVASSGGQAETSVVQLAELGKEKFPMAQEPLLHGRYVDDMSGRADTAEEREEQIRQTQDCLALGGLKTKFIARSGEPPPPEASNDGIGMKFLGYYYDPVKEIFSPGLGELNFNQRKRGAKEPNLSPVITKQDAVELMKDLVVTRQIVASKLAEFYDPLGLWEPYKLQLKLENSKLNGLSWKTPLDIDSQQHWKNRFLEFLDIPLMEVVRCVVPPNVKADSKVRLLCISDAAVHAGGSAAYIGYELEDGNFSCTLLQSKSRLLDGTVPRNELSAIMLMTELGYTVKKALGSLIDEVIYITDSTIALCWAFNTKKRLRHYVLNRVALIRQMIEWTTGESENLPLFHIDGELNIADLLTKPHDLKPMDLSKDSEWQNGKSWMKLPTKKMPLKTYEDLQVGTSDLCEVESECFQDPFIPSPGVSTHGMFYQGTDPLLTHHCPGCIATTTSTLSQTCYGKIGKFDHCDECNCTITFAFSSAATRGSSNLMVDIVHWGWQRSLRIMARLVKFKQILIHRAHLASGNIETREKLKSRCIRCNSSSSQLEQTYLLEAEMEFYRQDCEITTSRMTNKKLKEFKLERGILWFTGRLPELNSIKERDLDIDSFFDNANIKRVLPVIDSDSPVFYALVLYIHTKVRPHSGVEVTLREVSKHAHVLNNPRRLIQRVRKDCTRCRLILKKAMELEMAQHHEARVTIAPPFYNCMADIAYGFKGRPYLGARKQFPIYALVIVCVLTSASSILALEGLQTQNVIQALERHSIQYGVPNRIFVDNGTQLIALQNAEFTLRDLNMHVYDSMGLQVEVSSAKSHESRGRVEAKVKILRSMLQKLAINTETAVTALEWETCFGKIANQIDDLPMAKGKTSNVSDIGWDIITPNRLKLGRNNYRSLDGPIMISGNLGVDNLLENNRKIQHTWYQMLIDRLHHLIMKPTKWSKSDIPNVDDIVLFIYLDGQRSKNRAIWKLGKIIEISSNKRKVVIAFPERTEIGNLKIPKLKTLSRSLREVSVIYSVKDLPLNSHEHFSSVTNKN